MDSQIARTDGGTYISSVKPQDRKSFEVGEVRLEGAFTAGSPGSRSAVYMYSATTTPGEPGVTLQLRDPNELEEKGELSSVLARIQRESGTLNICYQSADIDSGIDVLVGSTTPSSKSSDKHRNSEDLIKLSAKKQRYKANSPNRQGPQQCQTCGKVFGNASALAKHKLTHSDERKYACTMCGKAFKRQDHLNGHMLTHRNKKPYECRADGCGKSYCDARSLRRHTENHHNGIQIPSSTTSSPCTPKEEESTQTCIHYAPPPSNDESTPPSTNSKTNSTQVSQLQKLLASESTPKSSETNGGGGSNNNNDGLAKQQLDLINQIMQQTQQETAVTQPKTSKSSSPTNSITSTTKQKTWSGQTNSCLKAAINSNKPVECNLCHRKFKNIPALNGHMRLHGGYFKKDSDSKKNDKKDVPGPPLQTASISVRALIEEKIIQKRTTGQSIQTSDTEKTEAGEPQTVPSRIDSSTESDVKLSPTASPDNTDKASPSAPEVAAFVSPTVTSREVSSTNEPDLQYADHPLLKRNPRPGVKRANSDPGVLQPSFNDKSTQPLQLSLPANYPLGLCRDENGYLSPPLPDDVLDQVQSVQETMLLQGVDPTQLAESIQAATLHDIASLDDYHSPSSSPNAFQHQKDLQRVLDSPLPVGLADFAYTHAQDGSNDGTTPPASTFANTSLPSPTFAYPTPPASQEGDSPPLFPSLQSVISQSNVSSPLSPTFYSSTVSSSAAVEAALSEVLPQHNYPSPPPQSPPTPNAPVTSPLSVPPASSSPVSSIAQSHMLPNSDDPLLSSNPRDFGFQRKADFQSFKLLPSGIIDFGNAGSQGVTGIVLDRNGELKLVQTSCFQKGMSNKSTVYSNAKAKFDPSFVSDNGSKLIKTVTISTKSFFSSAPKTFMDSLEVKDEMEDVFLSPSVPASPVRVTRKRPRLDNHSSLTQPYHSRLRKPRRRKTSEKQLLYTPPPILPPTRQGTGLYWQNVKPWPSSTTSKATPSDDTSPEMLPDYESGQECDISPHVNIGSKYQCSSIPQCSSSRCVGDDNPEDVLLWDANLSDALPEAKVDMFLDFACCAAVPGGGRNKEYALHILQMCKGNVHEALLRLMQPMPSLPEGHPLLLFDYPESEKWTLAEIDAFQHALLKHDKDFGAIVQEVSTKTVKECIQFYYIWKKICPEEYKKLRCTNESDIVSTSSESRLFVCEHQDCSASFNSKAALNGHMRLHVSGSSRCSTPDKKAMVTPTAHLNISDTLDEFPCKICGKIFNKVKSRSAHMKSHRPPDAEARKLKHEVQKVETAEQMTNRSSPVSSSNSALKNN